MTDTAKIRVQLDTSDAQREMDRMAKGALAAGGRVATAVKGHVMRGLGYVGLGTAVGSGIAALRGATQAGVGDVMSEAFGGIGLDIAEGLLGDLNERARASKSARDETIGAFSQIVGATGKIPAQAATFYEGVRALAMEREKGREILEREFRDVGVTDIVGRVIDGFRAAVQQGVEWLAEKLNPFG